MGHEINMYGLDQLPKVGLIRDQVEEIVNMYYRGSSGKFLIIFGECPKVTAESKRRGFITAGLHRYGNLKGVHEIFVDADAVIKLTKMGVVCGGNLKPIDARHAFCMALVHELQHANQTILRHDGLNISREGAYTERGSEKDARRASDEAFRELAIFLDYPLPEKFQPEQATDEETYQEICAIAEVFSPGDKVSVRDLNEELRHSNISLPRNLQVLRNLLGEIGVEVTR